jgi:group I intron endonuclease
MIGIYKITSPNGKIYIGQTIDFERRIKHYKLLKCKEQPRIHRSLIKYGVENHTFELVQECDKNNLTILERYYQELYKSTGKNGLNCILVATDEFSGGHSDESKKKISRALKGRKANQNAIDAVIKYNKERVLTDESRYNLGKGNRGKKQSEEWKKKLSEARKGLKRTDETKNKISESMSGRKLSEEHRLKLKSRVITDEWRRKLSEAAKNRKNRIN